MKSNENLVTSLCFAAPLSFEDLLKEERMCRQEVTAYEKKIENWSLAVKSDPRRPAAAAVGVSLEDTFLHTQSFLKMMSGNHQNLISVALKIYCIYV